MPLYLDQIPPADSPNSSESGRRGVAGEQMSECRRPTLTIGLVNNMKDGALEATERQFTSLLDAASQDVTVRLLLFQLRGIARGEDVSLRVAGRYSATDALWDEPLDGLIVTGREPSTARLQDEPYWESFVQLLDWAQDHTRSTIWSCLAAHAAVLHLDGIARVRSTHKHCGLFDCEVLSDHPVTAGTSSRFRIPHSRWNGLDEQNLIKCGYEVLTRSECVGVDAFLRQNGSMFVFFQGHPEYEANTLLLEYRRDVSRYLRGEAAVYPSLPHTYFDDATSDSLRELGREALLFPREELLGKVTAILGKTQLHNSWQSTAVSIYRNWLHNLIVDKTWLLEGSSGIVTRTPRCESEGSRVLD